MHGSHIARSHLLQVLLCLVVYPLCVVRAAPTVAVDAAPLVVPGKPVVRVLLASEQYAVTLYTLPCCAAVPGGLLDVRRLVAPQRIQRATPFPRQTPEWTAAVERVGLIYDVPILDSMNPAAIASMWKVKYAGIVAAEPLTVDTIHQVEVPDPLEYQQALLEPVRIREALALEPGDPAVVIALSDDAGEREHEDLVQGLYRRPGEIAENGIDDDQNGYIDDAQGVNFVWRLDGSRPGETSFDGVDHGTQVAGVAAARTRNGIGIHGLAGACSFFPMKTADYREPGIIAGYESILYAANERFPVLNCSWGARKPFSPIDQAIITYAVANNVAIVASAGNHGSSVRNYPASYVGVLGVGECDVYGKRLPWSAVGANADVFAPGYHAVAPRGRNQYDTMPIAGTSFAAPILSGLMALIRSKHPTLSPEQAQALARITASAPVQTDSYASMVTNMVNFEAALAADPMHHVAFQIRDVHLVEPGTLQPVQRFVPGMEADVHCVLTNVLGPLPDGAVFTMHIVDAAGWNIEILDSVSMPASAPSRSGMESVIGRLRIHGVAPMLAEVAVSVEVGDSVLDRRFVGIAQPGVMTTLENDRLSFSVGDEGMLGYNSSMSTRHGRGWNLKPITSMLAPSGFFASAGNRSVTAFNNVTQQSDFYPSKRFVGPDSMIGIMADIGAPRSRQIGLRVHQEWNLPSQGAYSTVTVKLTNTSDSTLNDVAAGYLLDWDLGYAGRFNRTAVDSVLPSVLDGSVKGCQVQYSDVDSLMVAVGAVTDDPDAVPQLAGMEFTTSIGDYDGFSDRDRLKLLSSGASIQTAAVSDVIMVVGMRFPGTLRPGQTKSFQIVFATDTTWEGVTEGFRQAGRSTTVAEATVEAPAIAMELAQGVLTIHASESPMKVLLVDLMGRTIETHPMASSSPYTYSCSAPAGIYVASVVLASGLQARPMLLVNVP
jgi:subtilisin family serine protease